MGSGVVVTIPLVLDVCGMSGIIVPLLILLQFHLEFNMCLTGSVTDYICAFPAVRT